MSIIISSIDTEKTQNLSNNSVLTFVFLTTKKVDLQLNKVLLSTALRRVGLKVIKITSTKSYKKTKFRTAKRISTAQFRPKKWYVKVDELKQEINEDFVKKMQDSIENQLFIKNKTVTK